MDSNDDRIECHKCGHMSATNKEQQTHWKKHHKQQKKLLCVLCRNSYTYEASLNNHMRCVHADFKYDEVKKTAVLLQDGESSNAASPKVASANGASANGATPSPVPAAPPSPPPKSSFSSTSTKPKHKRDKKEDADFRHSMRQSAIDYHQEQIVILKRKVDKYEGYLEQLPDIREKLSAHEKLLDTVLSSDTD